ncbi:MAG: hypothetical protein ACRDD7_06350 [Peptostreptococcaceae bacterium]
MYFIIGFLIGFITLPIIKEVRYSLMYNNWKKRIFSISFIKEVFYTIKQTMLN